MAYHDWNASVQSHVVVQFVFEYIKVVQPVRLVVPEENMAEEIILINSHVCQM